jgi:hypothetical protein
MRTLFLTTAAFAALVMVAPIGKAHAEVRCMNEYDAMNAAEAHGSYVSNNVSMSDRINHGETFQQAVADNTAAFAAARQAQLVWVACRRNEPAPVAAPVSPAPVKVIVQGAPAMTPEWAEAIAISDRLAKSHKHKG